MSKGVPGSAAATAGKALLPALAALLLGPVCSSPSHAAQPPLGCATISSAAQADCALAQRFRPFFKFSANGKPEPYHPVRWEDFIATTNMVEGSKVLETAGDLATTPTDLLTPAGANLKSSGNPPGDPGITLALVATVARGGALWSDVIHKGYGLYAHVEHVPGTTYVNIEYIILCAYNEGADNHDGDLMTVQLVYDAASDLLERVSYSIHGDTLQVYELADDLPKSFQTLDGLSVDGSAQHVQAVRVDVKQRWIDASVNVLKEPDNHVFFCRDASTGRYEHPAIYLEWGSHEPWPNASGFFSAAHNHNGDDVSFVPDEVIFLGSFDAPTPGQDTWVFYNGKLGDPQAVALHKSWYWPVGRANQPYADPSRFTDSDPYVAPMSWPPTARLAPHSYAVMPMPAAAPASTFIGLGPGDSIPGLQTAYSFAAAGSTLNLAQGSYAGPLLMDRTMTLEAAGAATIGLTP